MENTKIDPCSAGREKLENLFSDLIFCMNFRYEHENHLSDLISRIYFRQSYKKIFIAKIPLLNAHLKTKNRLQSQFLHTKNMFTPLNSHLKAKNGLQSQFLHIKNIFYAAKVLFINPKWFQFVTIRYIHIQMKQTKISILIKTNFEK